MSLHKIWTNVLALVIIGTSAHAAPFDGLYAPESGYADWSCNPEEIGMGGGAVAVRDGYLYGVESECELVNPTNVRGMNAVLYDAICTGEGEEYSYRVMMMRQDTGIYLVQDGFVSDWRNCQ
ncbi:hypothetical protein A9Q94_19105 [Rhodobacterales bacterium 56_14_T64]|nr:hypothetical protein A9Q94_19105 [Rhodobacterales bacterium 56_14_T64]